MASSELVSTQMYSPEARRTKARSAPAQIGLFTRNSGLCGKPALPYQRIRASEKLGGRTATALILAQHPVSAEVRPHGGLTRAPAGEFGEEGASSAQFRRCDANLALFRSHNMFRAGARLHSLTSRARGRPACPNLGHRGER